MKSELYTGYALPQSPACMMGVMGAVQSFHSGRVWMIALLVLVIQAAPADAYSPKPGATPEKLTVYSSNGRFAATIIPAWPGSLRSFARARIYAVNERGGRKRFARFPLLNEFAPRAALISDDGRWLVTIDEWRNTGYGDHVVVIYHSTGSVVRSFALEDLLTELDLASLSSTRQWSPAQRIESGQLVLYVSECYEISRCSKPIASLEIRLKDGQLLEPKRRLLWLPRVEIGPSSSEPGSFLEGVGEGSGSDAVRVVGFETLVSSALNLTPPKYPDLAQKARITGRVDLELLVAETGKVLSATVLKGLPMGLSDAARSAASDWRFLPSPSVVKTFATIRFDLVPGDQAAD